MGTIQISDQVSAVLGPEATQQAREISLVDAECFGCNGPLGPQDDSTVVVVKNDHFTYVRYAHARCSPSQLIEVPDDVQAPFATDAGVTAAVSAGLIEHGNVVLPTLITEISVRTYTTSTGDVGRGDLVDILATHLIGQGFSLVGRLREAPRKVEGWQIELTPLGTDGLFTEAKLQMTEPTGTVFYDGDVHLPPQWLAGLDRFGWCVLYVGNPGVAELPHTELKARLRALRTAAGAGRLVGARLPVTVTAR
jgi:hypothetical protein